MKQIFKFMPMVLLFALVTTFQSCIELDSGEIGVEEDYRTGDLTIYTTAGLKDNANVLDEFTSYEKEEMYDFTQDPIKIQFNDFGIGYIKGTVRYRLPQANDAFKKLHEDYGSQSAIEEELIRQAIVRSAYLAGPLMSSTESNAEKKPDLINYITDQSLYGVYKTTKVPTPVQDPVTRKTITKDLPTINECDTEGNLQNGVCVRGYVRQAESSVSLYDVELSDLTIIDIDYDQKTKEKIAAQQSAILAVEQSIVDAQEAQQDAIKAEEQGKAKAAEARWEQEAIKATAVTQAEKEAEVAKLDFEKEEWNRKAEEEKAAGIAAMVKAGVDPVERLKIETQGKVDIAKYLATRPVPTVVVEGGTNGQSGLSQSYQIEHMLMVADQISKQNNKNK